MTDDGYVQNEQWQHLHLGWIFFFTWITKFTKELLHFYDKWYD